MRLTSTWQMGAAVQEGLHVRLEPSPHVADAEPT